MLCVETHLKHLVYVPVPSPSSSDAMASPAVLLATFGFGPWVKLWLKLKLPTELPASVLLTRTSRVSKPNLKVCPVSTFVLFRLRLCVSKPLWR